MSKSTNKKENEKLSETLEGLSLNKASKNTKDQESSLDESVEEYTEKELEYLDRFKALAGHAMEDEELYEIIIKHNFNDRRIKEEIEDLLKLVKNKGEEYGWTKIEKGKKSKVEVKQPEQEKPDKNSKTHANKNSRKVANYSKSTYKNKKEEQNFSEQPQGQYEDSYVPYNNYDYNYNQGGYYNYRPRGRGYHRGRGSTRGRGRSGYYRNYSNNEDGLYYREVYLGEEVTVKPEEKETTKEQNQANESLLEEENNILNAKDIPSNIRSNIKNLIEESETEIRKDEKEQTAPVYSGKPVEKERCADKHHHHSENVESVSHVPLHSTKKEHHSNNEERVRPANTNHVPQTHIPHSSHTQGVFTISNTNTNLNKSGQNKFEEFSVSSSSLSIDQAKSNLPKQNNLGNTPVQSGTMTMTSSQTSESSINAPFRDTRDAKKPNNGINQKKDVKINTNTSGNNMNMPQNMMPQPMMPQGQNGEYPQGYLPWMSPMGFYYPQHGMQTYDPNNPSAYPMMPMFYLPPNYYQQEDDSQQKKRTGNRNMETQQQYTGSNEGMPGQMGMSFPQYAPFFYYNNPYGMMGMPGFQPGQMTPQGPMQTPSMDQQNFGYDQMKNMKGDDQGHGQNYYYNQFYKQG